MSNSTHDDEVHHIGPIKTSKQLLLTVLFAFVVPVLIIIGLVTYVASDNKPAGSAAAESHALGGLTADDLERGVAERIRKVGTVEIGDAGGAAPASAQAAATSAPAAATAPAAAAAPAAAGGANAGEALYKQSCAMCHGAGIAGAPKFGDKAAWAPRIQQGMPAVVQNAIKGKNGMPAKGGTSASDADIKAAVEYMVNASK
jgi:cytochrome c5